MNLQQIAIYPFPSSSKHDTQLLEIDGRFFEIGKDTAELLEHLKTHGCGEDSIASFSNAHDGRPSIDEITKFLNVLAKRLDTDSNHNGVRDKSFVYRKDFISAAMLRKFTSLFSRLFHPWFMSFVVAVFVGLELAYFLHYRDEIEQTLVNVYLIAGLYFLWLFLLWFMSLVMLRLAGIITSHTAI